MKRQFTSPAWVIANIAGANTADPGSPPKPTYWKTAGQAFQVLKMKLSKPRRTVEITLDDGRTISLDSYELLHSDEPPTRWDF